MKPIQRQSKLGIQQKYCILTFDKSVDRSAREKNAA